MARMVRGCWQVTDKGWGIRGHDHPRFDDYVWVEWVDCEGKPERFKSGQPAEGYYRKDNLVEIGTAILG